MRVESTFRWHFGVLWTVICTVLACGCTTANQKLSPAQQIAQAPACESLYVFDGATRAPITWFELLLRVARSNAVFVGETHDDASGHRVEQALVVAFLLAHPGGAVSLEMLERNEQGKVDAFLKGELALDAFIDETGSRHWAEKDSWLPWYQPMLESARLAGTPVVAANAPRKYVSQALREGYEPLLALPVEERAHFEIDPTLTRDGDWQRLKDLMTELHKERSASERLDLVLPSDEDVDRVHRSQRIWDRTMGTSAALAFVRHGSVLHCAGGFHLEGQLGTVAQFKMRCPDAKTLVISLQPSASASLNADDVHGADIVVHTRAQQ